MKKFLIALFFMTGCAAFLGQEKYTGSVVEPTMAEERIVHLPETPSPGIRSGQNDSKEHIPYAWTQELGEKQKQKEALANYWDLPVDKVARLLNPLNDSIRAHIYCYSSFPSTFEFVVPAHTSQDMLFTTNAAHMHEKLCELQSYEVVNATR